MNTQQLTTERLAHLEEMPDIASSVALFAGPTIATRLEDALVCFEALGLEVHL